MFINPLLTAFREHNALRKHVWRALSLLLAFNYFAFRTELFSEEYEQNNPVTDSSTHQVAFSFPTLNWETFDKDNAPKAFVINPPIKILIIGIIPSISNVVRFNIQSFEPIRDKSPPSNPITSNISA